MTIQIPVDATVTPTESQVSITSDMSGAGQLLTAVSSNSIQLTNIDAGQNPLQYKIDSGSWITLGAGQGVQLPLDMSASAVRVRKGNTTAGAVKLGLTVYTVDGIQAGGVPLKSFPGTAGAVSAVLTTLAQQIGAGPSTLKPLSAMTSPPTISEGAINAASGVNGNASGVVTIGITDPRVAVARTIPALVGAGYPDNLYYKGAHINKAQMDYNAFSVPFITDAPKFDFMMKGNRGRYLVFVDGEPVTLNPAPNVKATATSVFVQVDFGADVMTYGAVAVDGVGAGGTGYAIGDLITLAGGTGTGAVLEVKQLSGSAVVGATIVNRGAYTAISYGTTQASNTGAGIGATFNMRYGTLHSTRKERRIELCFSDNAYFGGINVASQDTVRAWTPPGLRMCGVGDSFMSGTFQDRPGGAFIYECGRLLGIPDTWDAAVGGTGYIATNNATQKKFRDRLSDLVAIKPSVIVVCGGINDSALSGVTVPDVQAEVGLYYAALFALFPRAVVICTGPWQGANVQAVMPSLEAAIKAGFEGASGYNPKLHAFISTVVDKWIVPGGANGKAGTVTGVGNTEFITSSDGTHPHQYGQDYLGQLLANGIRSVVARLNAAA